MAHFAELDSDNVVQQVIVVSDKNTSDSDGNESEAVGVAYCQSLYGSDTIWKQCSYTMKRRGIYPGNGSLYNSEMDIFHLPSPFPSWVLQSDASWASPIEEPALTEEQESQGAFLTWNETAHQADNTKGWDVIIPPNTTIALQPSTDVSVAVGSKVTVSADVTATKGEFSVSVQTLEDDDDFWVPTGWGYVVQDAGDSSLTATASITSGIITATSCAGKYRVFVEPISEVGVSTYSDTITLTVTE